MIDTTGLSWEHFNQLKERTRIFDILDNPSYSTDSKVLVFGPDDGLAYYTHLAVWNLEFGYGLSGIKDFVDNEESEILNFINKSKIEYFLLYNDEPSLTKFSKAKERSKFFQILVDERYFEQVVKQNEQNLWILFKLK